MRKMVVFFMLVLAPLSALDMPPVYEISNEGTDLVKQLRKKTQIDAILSKVEGMYSHLSAQSNSEIDQFFEKARLGCDDFAKDISEYRLDTPDNRKAISESFQKKVFSENDFLVLQKNLNEKIKAEFKKQLEQTFAENDIFEEREGSLKELYPNNSKVTLDNGFMNKNLADSFLVIPKIGLDFIVGNAMDKAAACLGEVAGGVAGGVTGHFVAGPAGAAVLAPIGAKTGKIIARAGSFAIQCHFSMSGSSSTVDGIKSKILPQLEAQKNALKDEVSKMQKENLQKICDIIREKLEMHFQNKAGQ